MAGKFKIQGEASGTFESKVLRGNPLTCHLESMTFFNAAGEQIDPGQGITLFEYLSYNDNEWREWDLASRNDYGDGLNYPSRVTGKLIRKVRVTFSGFPVNTTFVARFYHLPFPDGSLDGRLQNGDQALTVQPFTEANCKDGLQFYKIIPINGQPANSDRWVQFTTGNKDILVKLARLTTNNQLAGFTLFRAPTITGGTGVAQTVRNYNDRTTVPATTTTVIDNVTVTANGVQVTDEFRAIGSDQAGNRASGGSEDTGIELVLRKNTTYAWRINNPSGSNALTGEFYWTFYEGPISVDI